MAHDNSDLAEHHHVSGVNQTHPNPGSYDDCAERALVNRLLEVFNCSVITPKVPKKYHKTSGPQSTPVPKITSKETFTENIQVPFISAGQDLPTCEVNETAQEVTYKVCFAYTGCFFTGTPPKSSKYKKVNLS